MTMRPIDADALKESLIETLHRCDEWIENAKDGETRTIAEANYTAFLESILRVKDSPTIDAVPVVRCKDCRHWCEMQNLTGACLRLCAIDGALWMGTDATDFCSFAERRNDETD